MQTSTQDNLQTSRQLIKLVEERTQQLNKANLALKEASAAHERITKALHTSEEHLNSLMQTAEKFMIYRLVEEQSAPNKLKVVFVSPSAKDILGVADPMDFESWFDNMHTDDVERITKANRKAFETNRFDEEYRTYHKQTGEWRWVHAISVGGRGDGEKWNRYVNGIIIDITAKQKAYAQLEQKEQTLKRQAEKLEKMNMALNVLLEQRNTMEAKIEKKIISSINTLILPEIYKLRTGKIDAKQGRILDSIEFTLKEMSRSYAIYPPKAYKGLTPSEQKIATYIMQGLQTKEIAELVGLAAKTIKNQRGTIRKKLGLTGNKISLMAYLRSMSDE